MARVIEPATTKGPVRGCFYQPSIDDNRWEAFCQCGWGEGVGPWETARMARRALHEHVQTHIRFEETREVG